jgi:hypothetical protein
MLYDCHITEKRTSEKRVEVDDMLQYRITWSAWSNISFTGHGEWQDWDDEDATADDIDKAMNKGKLTIDGLEEALDKSGFEWRVETREKSDK